MERLKNAFLMVPSRVDTLGLRPQGIFAAKNLFDIRRILYLSGDLPEVEGVKGVVHCALIDPDTALRVRPGQLLINGLIRKVHSLSGGVKAGGGEEQHGDIGPADGSVAHGTGLCAAVDDAVGQIARLGEL